MLVPEGIHHACRGAKLLQSSCYTQLTGVVRMGNIRKIVALQVEALQGLIECDIVVTCHYQLSRSGQTLEERCEDISNKGSLGCTIAGWHVD
jgi:hypothetical protein